MKKTTLPQIQETSDYDLFKPHGEQQPMQPPHVRRLIKSMQQVGFIKAKPIHVYKDGDHYRVIDGHHRLRACQTLKIPVYFVVSESSESSFIAMENWAVRKWTSEAFINMYASRGIKDYIEIVSYVKRGIPARFAASMLSGESTNSGNKDEAIRAGTFKIKTRSTINEAIHIIDSISSVSPEAKSRSFLAAIAVLVYIPEFQSSVLISRILTNPRMLVKCSNRDQMFELIEEIYNFRSRDKVNLAFLARDYLKNRSFAPKQK